MDRTSTQLRCRHVTQTVAALMLSALLFMQLPPAALQAQRGAGADWEPTGLSESVSRLFTPASGALLARTSDSLLRSDDGGINWVALPLPPYAPGSNARAGLGQARIVEVDPVDQEIVYVTSTVPDTDTVGLYKSTDRGTTWRLLWTMDAPARWRVVGIAVSPADHELVYLEVAAPYEWALLRSHDGGANWDRAWAKSGDTGNLWQLLLVPHPTDVSRLFRADIWGSARSSGNALEHSGDQGATWGVAWQNPAPAAGTVRRMASPAALVGGRGVAPRRFYLALANDSRVGGSSLQGNDDDGLIRGWRELLSFLGGGSDTGTRSRLQLGPDAANVQTTGLAYNPASPDRVYAGLNEYTYGGTASLTRRSSRVIASTDGGDTWADLTQQDLGTIQDLALGIDALNLYAATDQGLWRLRLDR